MRNSRLRYYLRGLGVGIFVSVLILCLTQKSQGTMTDEQVRERALELGMIDSTGLMLSDLQKDTKDNGLPESISGTDTLQEEDFSKVQSAESGEQSGTEETQPEESGEQSDMQNAEITVEIPKGATSYSVSKELEAVGLIESAKAFDKYLCDQGYSKSIRAGVYTIKSGESEAEIAKIITGKR